MVVGADRDGGGYGQPGSDRRARAVGGHAKQLAGGAGERTVGAAGVLEHIEPAVAVEVEIDDVGEAGAVGPRRPAGHESPDGGLAGGERDAGGLAYVVGAIGAARDRSRDGVGGAALGRDGNT